MSLSRLSMLFTACLLLMGAGLNQEADRYLQERLVSWADSSEAARRRMQISADAVIDAMVQWDSAGERVYPPLDGLPHVSEDRMLADLRRLEALRKATDGSAWERVAMDSDTYYRCFRDRCLQVDGAALGRVLGWDEGSHTSLVGTSRVVQGWAVAAGLGAALAGFAALAVFRWRLGRGPGPDANSDVFAFGPLTIDPVRLCIAEDDERRAITKRELTLLQLFVLNPEAVLTKDQLYDAGWGRDYQPSSRALDQQILTLRRKLDPERRHGDLIETVHGQGYRFRA